jgi:RNA polymerase sigma-70 factor (ECF subfamily)
MQIEGGIFVFVSDEIGDCGELYEEVPEHELVRKGQHGDVKAFEELVRRTQDQCFRIATGILGVEEDAQDEVQNAYWLAYSRIRLFDFRAKFASWLTRIVINRCLMRLRQARRFPTVRNSWQNPEGISSFFEGTDAATPELELGQKQVRQLLRRELRSIPPLLRTPIELHYLEEMPVKKIARRLGLSTAATKSRLHRGQAYLRDRMMKHIPEGGSAAFVA